MIIYVLILLLSFILDAKTLAPFRKLNVPRNTALNHLHSFQHLRVGSISSAPPKDSVFFATVSTIVGSKLFDKTKRFSLPANSTVKDVKDLIKLSFPGDIPCSMQSLYFGSKQLLDDDIVAELSPGVSTVPLLLDTLSIVSPPPISAGGDLSMTLSQSIDTCVALYVYQLYINSKLLLAISPGQIQDTSSDEEENEDSEDTLTDSEKYGSLLAIINHTIHERFSGEIARAREEEKDPEVYSEETVRWRGRWAATSMDAQKTTETLASDQQRVWDVLIPKRVLQAVMPWFAHHFDCNADTFREYTIYSLLLWYYSKYEALPSFPLAKVLLVFSIPALWLSRVRVVRQWTKEAVLFILITTTRIPFLFPLLPVAYQTIARAVTEKYSVLDEVINPGLTIGDTGIVWWKRVFGSWIQLLTSEGTLDSMNSVESLRRKLKVGQGSQQRRQRSRTTQRRKKKGATS